MCFSSNTLADADFPNQQGKIVVITGANTGLGLATAKNLVRKGARVVLACRSEERAQLAIKEVRKETPHASVEFMQLDLGDLQSVERFARNAAARLDHIDVLMNNAGVMMPPYSTTKDNFELQFGTNHLGHFALTLQLLPLLRKAPSGSARVVVVSSIVTTMSGAKMHWDDVNWFQRKYDDMATYQQSKLANLLFALELRRRLRATPQNGARIEVVSAHPGWSSTELQRHGRVISAITKVVAMSVERGCLSQLYAAVSPNAKDGQYYGPSLGYWGRPSEASVPKLAQDTADAARLWELSVKLTKVDM